MFPFCSTLCAYACAHVITEVTFCDLKLIYTLTFSCFLKIWDHWPAANHTFMICEYFQKFHGTPRFEVSLRSYACGIWCNSLWQNVNMLDRITRLWQKYPDCDIFKTLPCLSYTTNLWQEKASRFFCAGVMNFDPVLNCDLIFSLLVTKMHRCFFLQMSNTNSLMWQTFITVHFLA